MARFLHPESSPSFRKWSKSILALSFIFGALFGFKLFFSAENYLTSLMGGAILCSVSIVQLLIPFLLPFLFSAIAVYLSAPWLIYAVCFLKTALFSYISCGVVSLYGSAGWLVHILFLFSDIFYLVLLYWYWIRHVSSGKAFSTAEAFRFLLAASLISGIDFYIISPFLQGLL